MKAVLNELKYADTEAAMLLGGAIAERARERISLRELGRRLNYKQPVVLSHMALGRVPIPIDRALEIAAIVGLPPKKFLLAVLEQRHPEVEWPVLIEQADFANELESLAGTLLDDLQVDTKSIIREAVVDPSPVRRWLSIAELATVEMIREMRPHVRTEGLTAEDRKAIREALRRGHLEA